jgi:RHS repeat-associated protein
MYNPWGEEMHQWNANTYAFTSPYRFNAKELDPETGLAYYGARYHHPKLSVWKSVDPLAAKYPHESPYLFCGGNPIIYIDPDGREKIIALDKKNKKDQTIIAGSEKYADDGAIHIFGHGNTSGMYLNMDGKRINIKNAEQLEAFLSEYSETWQNKGEGDKPVIVLHSCNTGKDQKDGSASLAQQISESDLFKDATIIAPDELLWTDSNGQVGAYKAKTDSDGEFKSNDRGSKIRSEETGSWRVFQGGKQTGQYRGDWKPKEQPTLWDRLTKKEEVK